MGCDGNEGRSSASHSASYHYALHSHIVHLSGLKNRKHPTPMTIQLHPQCLLGIQAILRNWTFLIFKQV